MPAPLALLVSEVDDFTNFTWIEKGKVCALFKVNCKEGDLLFENDFIIFLTAFTIVISAILTILNLIVSRSNAPKHLKRCVKFAKNKLVLSIIVRPIIMFYMSLSISTMRTIKTKGFK